MKCEQCQGDCWDNREKNNERAKAGKTLMPDYSCKDKDGCGWVKWRPKEKKEAKSGGAFITTANNRELLKIASDLAINGAKDDIFEIIKANLVKLIRLEQDANYLATKRPDEQASPDEF